MKKEECEVGAETHDITSVFAFVGVDEVIFNLVDKLKVEVQKSLDETQELVYLLMKVYFE